MTNKRPNISKLDANSLQTKLDELVTAREIWEREELKNSNSSLYDLLGNCLDLYTAIRASRTLSTALNDYLENNGLKTTAAASAQLRIVRAVFVSRKAADKNAARLIGYAKVIKIAADNDCTGKTISAFINKHHGIEAIRRSTSNASSRRDISSTQNALKLARDAFEDARANTLLKSISLPHELAPQPNEKFSVAIVRLDADGKGSVVFGTNDVKAVTSMLAFAGRQLSKDANHKNQEEEAVQMQAEKQAGLEAFEDALAEA